MARYSLCFVFVVAALVGCSKDDAASTPSASGTAAPAAQVPAPAGSASGEDERRHHERGDGGEWRGGHEGPRPEHS
jgi:hypothetical protein